MSQFLWHTVMDPSGNWLGIMDEEKDDRWKASPWFSYQLRHIDVTFAKYPFFVLWPPGTMFINSVSPILGQDLADGTPHQAAFEHWTVIPRGANRFSFVMGQCLSAGGAGLAGTVVTLVLTSTGAAVSTGVCDSNGNYQLPTPYAGQNHFVYASYANDTYVGASISTLTPNF